MSRDCNGGEVTDRNKDVNRVFLDIILDEIDELFFIPGVGAQNFVMAVS
jgi:hypothetical protein